MSSKASIKYAENQVKQQIQQQVISLALQKVNIKMQNEITSSMQVGIIDKNIMQLKGDIII